MMAKQKHASRGERGIPGPPGPVGRTGATGKTGATGRRGAAGKPVAAAPSIPDERMELLTLVEGQIEDIYKELDIQMKRMAQLQMQIDELRATVRKLTGNTISAVTAN